MGRQSARVLSPDWLIGSPSRSPLMIRHFLPSFQTHRVTNSVSSRVWSRSQVQCAQCQLSFSKAVHRNYSPVSFGVLKSPTHPTHVLHSAHTWAKSKKASWPLQQAT